jgi:membrane peptidoglycan carboxypeptidase
MLYGTGRGAHVVNHTDAGKTGTTDNYADAWFSGYTPRLMATVWIGYPQGEVPMLSVHGIAVSGPTFPAQIWHLFMDTAVGNRPDVPFPPARTEPVWTSWRGQYQYSGAYAASSSTTTAAATATTRSGGTTTARSTPVTTPAPVPPTTTEAPPVTTEPVTTTAPPPPTALHP